MVQWSMSTAHGFRGGQIVLMESFKSLFWINTLINKKMDFSVTSFTEHAKVLNRAIVMIFVNVMYVQIPSFFLMFSAKTTYLWQLIASASLITPTTVFSTIQMMRSSINRVLAFFRTKTRNVFLIRKHFVSFSTVFTGESDFWFGTRNSKALFGTEKRSSSFTRSSTDFARTKISHSSDIINQGRNI